MQRRSILLLAFSLALIFGAVPTRASQTVWSGLVMANNVAQPEPIPAELRGMEGAQSKYFSLLVDSKSGNEAGYLLNLKLFQEKSLLLETDAKLSKASPLVIK